MGEPSGGRRLVAVHTVLRDGAEEEYDRIHRRIPADVAEALRANGVHDWRIWRDGVHLFHLIDVEDYRRMRRALAADPANEAWQAAVAPLLDVPDDYSGGDDGLMEVWTLSGQLDQD